MKYLFLDIDGVLNHEEWYRERIKNYKDTFTCWEQECFDPDCVERVNRILKETGARLVISSSWRLDTKLSNIFETVGLPTDFDITPTKNIFTDDRHDTRGEEIEEFLKENPCDQYVILDDDMDFNEDQLKCHFVHCCADYLQALQEGNEGQTGLTELKMRESIRILNKEQ